MATISVQISTAVVAVMVSGVLNHRGKPTSSIVVSDVPMKSTSHCWICPSLTQIHDDTLMDLLPQVGAEDLDQRDLQGGNLASAEHGLATWHQKCWRSEVTLCHGMMSVSRNKGDLRSPQNGCLMGKGSKGRRTYHRNAKYQLVGGIPTPLKNMKVS